MAFTNPSGNKVIYYYYDNEVGNFYYGQGHPMKPHRIRMTHNLLLNYNVLEKLKVIKPRRATEEQMTIFHSDQYVNFLKNARPEINYDGSDRNKSFPHNVGDDSPVFDGIFEFCQISCGGSLAGANKLNLRETDIAINYAGGLHHAKKEFASGFCYINDIVLAILELLKVHQRVLYLDIDIHHGDGVEEAFYATNRVMTVSFHKFGEFFPGTGDIRDIGVDKGKHYSVNVPLRDGITDEVYQTIFKPVVSRVIEAFKPEAIVLQCGADSLTGDRLGCFNLTLKGHGECVSFVKSLGLPLLVLGGGGYTIRNVSRCWTYETSLLANIDLPDDLPYNDYYEYYGPDFKLHIPSSNATNMNNREYLEKIRERVFENLRCLFNSETDNREIEFGPGYQSDSEDEDRDLNERSRSKITRLDYRRSTEYMDQDDFDRLNPHRMSNNARLKQQIEEYEEDEDEGNTETISSEGSGEVSSRADSNNDRSSGNEEAKSDSPSGSKLDNRNFAQDN